MIKICRYNNYLYEIAKFLTENSMEFSIEDCEERCDICRDGAFIKYENNMIAAEDPQKLIYKIREICSSKNDWK